ncbi:MAG: transglycosylase domain-containing protein, partial [Pseudomonadota bacterium]
MISQTGEFIFATLLALSQFVQPFSQEQIDTMVAKRCPKEIKSRCRKDKTWNPEVCELKASGRRKACKENPRQYIEQWRLDAYEFAPKSPGDLRAMTPSYQDLMLDDPSASYRPLATYIRSACIRLMSMTQSPKDQKDGKLLILDFEKLFDKYVDESKIAKKQSRLMPDEQNIVLLEGKDYVLKACQQGESLLKMANFGLSQSLDYYNQRYEALPQLTGVEDLPEQGEVSFIFDREGRLIGEYSLTQVNSSGGVVKKNRRRLPEGKIPLLMKHAIVSIEDARFWNFEAEGSTDFIGHRGVDFKGALRAAKVSGSQDKVQGASTLTMQLAKNLLLYADVAKEHELGKRSLKRKLDEYILSRRLEEILSKDQILDWYLNVINFGRNSQGVVMAAKAYFDKSLEELELHEIAFLMALPKGPNYLDPAKGAKQARRALGRRNDVLLAMLDHHYISQQEYDTAKRKSLGVRTYQIAESHFGYAQQYLNGVEWQVKKWLRSQEMFPHSGFDIEIPMDHEMQKWAVDSMQRGLLSYERRVGEKSQQSLVVRPSEDLLPNLWPIMQELAKESYQKYLLLPEVAARPPVQEMEVIPDEPIVDEQEEIVDEFPAGSQQSQTSPTLPPSGSPTPVPRPERIKKTPTLPVTKSPTPLPKPPQPQSFWVEALGKLKNPYPDAQQFRLGVIYSKTQLGFVEKNGDELTGVLVNRQPKDRDGKRFKLVDGEKINLDQWDVVLLQKMKASNGGHFYRIASAPQVNGAMVVIDNKTGEVLATSSGFSVGANGRYRGEKGNLAFSGFRQPGSTVKPFTYLLGLKKGLQPFSIIPDRAVDLPKRYNLDREEVCGPYQPKGGLAAGYGYSTLRSGLEKS